MILPEPSADITADRVIAVILSPLRTACNERYEEMVTDGEIEPTTDFSITIHKGGRIISCADLAFNVEFIRVK